MAPFPLRLSGTSDTLVVDEAPDFEPGWAPPLPEVVRDGSRRIWLEDPDQNLYRRERVPLPGWVELESPVDYRSPPGTRRAASRCCPGTDRAARRCRRPTARPSERRCLRERRG